MTGIDTSRSPMGTLADIAARDGISKQAVSEKVQRLLKSGLSVEKDVRGRVALINVAQYDALRERFDRPQEAKRPNKPEKIVRSALVGGYQAPSGGSKPAAPTTGSGVTPSPPVGQNYSLPLGENDSYDEAMRQKTWAAAEKLRYETDLMKGRLMESLVMANTLERAAVIVEDAFERGKDFADDLAAAVGQDGVQGSHAMLGTILRTIKADAVRGFLDEARRIKAALPTDDTLQ